MDEKKRIEKIIWSITDETIGELIHRLSCIQDFPMNEYKEAIRSAIKWYLIEQS